MEGAMIGQLDYIGVVSQRGIVDFVIAVIGYNKSRTIASAACERRTSPNEAEGKSGVWPSVTIARTRDSGC